MASQQELKSTISLYGKVDSSVGALARELSSIGKTVSKVGGAISTLSVPIIAAGKESISLYTDYDDIMKSIQAVGGYTASEMETISDAARKAGAETRFMATDAGSAFLYLTQAGVDMQASLDVLPSLLDAAAAGQMDLATTSDLLISNIYSLGKSFSETDVSTYVDAVTMAADATNTNLEEIMEGVSKIGAAGRMFGGGTNELLTFMGLLSNLNLKGSEGGVNARNMIISLLAPTDKAGKLMESLSVTEEELGEVLDGVNLEDSAKLMKKLGLETTTSEGKVRPMIDILTDLKGALSGMADDEQADALYTIFGKRTYPAVAGLLELLELYPEIFEQVENSMGSAKKKAEIMESGIGGSTRRLKSAMEELGLAVGEMASPTVMGWMEKGRDLILDIAGAIDSLDPATAENITELLGGIAVAGPGLVIAGKGIESVGTVLGSLTTPTGKVLAVAAAFGLLAVMVNNAQEAAAQQSLSEHFGNIEVDAEKMQGIIDSLSSSYETKAEGLEKYATAISTASTNYQTAMSQLSGGLLEAYFTQTELNETDKKSLMTYAKNLTTEFKTALGQQKLRIGDIIDISFDGTESDDPEKNSGWDTFAASVFSGLEEEANAVGAQIRAKMVEALKDGNLNEDELEAIRASQARLNEIMAQISRIQGDYDTKTAYNKAMLMSYASIDEQLAAVDEAEKTANEAITNSYASLFALVDIAEEQGTAVSEDLQKTYGVDATDYAGLRTGLTKDLENDLLKSNNERSVFAARIASEAFNAYGEELNSYYDIVDQISEGKLTFVQALDQARKMRKDKTLPRTSGEVEAVKDIRADMSEHLSVDDLMKQMDYQLAHQGFVDSALSGLYRDYLASAFFAGGFDIDSDTPWGLADTSDRQNVWSEAQLGTLGSAADIERYAQAQTITAPLETSPSAQEIISEINAQGGNVEPIEVPTKIEQKTGDALTEELSAQIGENAELTAPVTVTPEGGEAGAEFATEAQSAITNQEITAGILMPDGYEEGEYFAQEAQEALDDNPGEMEVSLPIGYAVGVAFANAVQDGLDSVDVTLPIAAGPSSGTSNKSSSSSSGLLGKVKSALGFAEGGRATTASIFGEAGPEWAIPEEHTQRTAELLASAAKASGFTMSEIAARAGGLSGNVNSGGNSSFVYSPTIYANDARGVKQALDGNREELEAMFEAFMRQRERVSFA